MTFYLMKTTIVPQDSVLKLVIAIVGLLKDFTAKTKILRSKTTDIHHLECAMGHMEQKLDTADYINNMPSLHGDVTYPIHVIIGKIHARKSGRQAE